MKANADRIVDHFALALSALRQGAGWSQRQLADRVGVSRTYIGLIEKGLRRPSLHTAILLAAAFDKRLSELLEPLEK